LFVDSSFGFDRPKSDVMAGWRQAVEIAMSEDEVV
jgi:hypothetical protein